MFSPRLVVLTCMILMVAASRLVPHPPNFAPITAIALFGGACFSKRSIAFIVPLTALFLSDLVLGLYTRMYVVYGCFAVIVCIGRALCKHRQPKRIAAATLAGSVLFFIVTNLGVFIFGSLYPKTITGLVACYVAAIPFFENTMMGDAFYTAALFGGLALAEMKWPALLEPNVARI